LLGPVGNILGHNMYAYTQNNPVMYVDPSGEIAISSTVVGLLIFAGIMITGGGIIGGISAGESGSSIIEGVGKGMLVGAILSLSIAMVFGGFAFGATTILGSTMASYGISVSANMLEIMVLQGKKSGFDGDSFWNSTNDIVNATTVNMDRYLLGRMGNQTVGFLGTRVISKLNILHKFAMTVGELNQLYSFQSAFRIASQSFWTQKLAAPNILLAYGFSAYNVIRLGIAIFSSSTEANKRWVLF